MEELATIAYTGGGGVDPGSREHLLNHIDPNDAAAGTHKVRREDRGDPTSGAHVEHYLSRPQFRAADRVANAQRPAHGALGQEPSFILAVEARDHRFAGSCAGRLVRIRNRGLDVPLVKEIR